MRYFLDTGILLRLFDRSDPHHATIREAVRAIRAHGHSFHSAAQNIAEFWNVSTRPQSARGGYGQSIAATDRRVRFLEHFGTTLHESAASYAIWRQLLVTYQVSGVAAHDARLVAIAHATGISEFVTLNDEDFRRYPGIHVLRPEDVLRVMSS